GDDVLHDVQRQLLLGGADAAEEDRPQTLPGEDAGDGRRTDGPRLVTPRVARLPGLATLAAHRLGLDAPNNYPLASHLRPEGGPSGKDRLRFMKTSEAHGALRESWEQGGRSEWDRVGLARALLWSGDSCGVPFLEEVARRADGVWSGVAATALYGTSAYHAEG